MTAPTNEQLIACKASCDKVSALLAQLIGTPPNTQPGSTGTNVALGGAVTVSSSVSAAYPASSIVDGDRMAKSWGSGEHGGGGWAGAYGSFPQTVDIVFKGGAQSISSVTCYTVQDDFLHPVEPSDTMTFNDYGNTAWTIAAGDGTILATVSGNNLVKRTSTFPAYTTDRIRITITAARGAWALLTEVEVHQ